MIGHGQRDEVLCECHVNICIYVATMLKGVICWSVSSVFYCEIMMKNEFFKVFPSIISVRSIELRVSVAVQGQEFVDIGEIRQ